MQRLTRRLVVCGVVGLFVACSGDPTDNTGTPTQIVLNPGVVFVPQGDSQPVIATVVDEDGQALQADFTATDIGAGISVQLDPTFLPVSSSNPIRRSARFFVKGVDLTATTFKVNALGLTNTVSVTSVPANFTGTFSTTTPALGDTVTLTAPAGASFTDSTRLTFAGQPAAIISKDATTIVFLPPPNVAGLPAGLTNVAVASNPNLVFTLITTETFTTDSIRDIGANLTPTSPALGAPVTLVLPTDLRVIPESLHQTNVGADTLERGVAVAGSPFQPLNITVSADSTTITFIPPPNADTTVEVPGVINRRLPQFPLKLATTAKLTTPVVDSIPATLNTATPAANQVVTLTTTSASFTIDPAATVSVGGAPATVFGTTANSISFVPAPGDSGNVSVNGVVVVGFNLDLPSKAPAIQVAAATPLAGTAAQGSAPSVPIPGTGESRVLYDLPDFAGAADHFYKLTIPADGDYTVTVDWDIGSDLDVFVCDSPVASNFSNCDFAAATGDHPESSTFTLTAGTHFIVVDDFGADADGATLTIQLDH